MEKVPNKENKSAVESDHAETAGAPEKIKITPQLLEGRDEVLLAVFGGGTTFFLLCPRYGSDGLSGHDFCPLK